MKSVGIICEYNPFHNGHLYHINKIKEMFPDYTIILVMSSSFTERGEVSIVNKFDKINYDKDLIYTKCFYDLGFYITKSLNLKYLNIWYNETLGKYRRYYTCINQSSFNKLYNHWLKI